MIGWLRRRRATPVGTHDVAPPRVPGAMRDALSFSVITCVYERSDASLLRETFASIAAQSHRRWEWVLLAQGDLPPALREVVESIRADDRARVLDSETNLGIVAGMRRCLEAATGNYVVPVDGDDLIEPEALRTVATWAIAEGRPPFLFSEEDTLDRGAFVHPWARPGWDPMLGWSTSYIWHLCAFDRERALELDVFGDDASNWCQDWDTQSRFADTDDAPCHVPAVLYHWRAHAASQTNQPEPDSGSVRSQRNVLLQRLGRHGLDDRLEVTPFPIPRGGPTEWWIAPKAGITPRFEVRRWQPDDATCLQATDDLDFVAFVDPDAVAPRGDVWPREAWTCFTLQPDLALLSPRILDAQGYVVGGGGIFGFGGLEANPFHGRAWDDAGPYALALKHRTVSTVPSEFFVVRADFLRSLEASVLAGETHRTIGITLGRIAAERERRVAQSPLIDAMLQPGRVPSGLTEHELARLLRECEPHRADALVRAYSIHVHGGFDPRRPVRSMTRALRRMLRLQSSVTA